MTKSKLLIILFTIPLLTYCNNAFSQVIKIENGVNLSAINAEKIDVLEDYIASYAISVGIDYIERGNFYLSSQVGYLKKGGKEKNELLPADLKKIKESWNYINLNTTIRYAFKLRKNARLFVGAGPKLDILMQSNNLKSPVFEGYKLNSTIFGLKGEIGFVKDIQKIRLGLNFSYLYDITKAGKTDFISFKNNAFRLMFLIGYRIN